jgi:hypothetical protein
LAQNPLEWARRELPVMQARGLLGGTPEQNEQFILQMMMRIFKNAQTAQIMAVLFNNLMQGSASSLAQFAAQRGRALGAEDAYGVQQETTSEKVLALGKSFGLLMDAISEKIKPTFNAQVDALRGFFDVMTRFVHNTPAGVLRATAVGLEVLGASLILLAGARVFAALTAFAFGGWAAVGIAAIIALIGMLATLDWQAVGTMLEKIYNAIYRFLQKIGLIAKDDVTAATPHRQPATANFLIPSVTQTDPLLKRILPQWMQDWAGSTGRMNVPSNLPGLGWLPSTLQTRQEEKQAITMHLSLELDGQVLASAVAQGMVSYGQFPHTGAASNGWSGWPGTDQNILPR